MKCKFINLEGRPDRHQEFLKEVSWMPELEVERIKGVKSRVGEDGCTQSHLLALRSIDEFPTMVCEDDCVFIHSWTYIESIMDQLPEGWDALWLGANLQTPLKQYSTNLFHLRDAYCLHATIYNSKKMIDYILENHNTPSGKNLDVFYHKEVFNRFNCFITYPMCANQRDGVSNICGDWTSFGDELEERFEKMTRNGNS